MGFYRNRILPRLIHWAIRPKLPIEFIEGSAEAIPLETASVDAVLTTWTLCSIPDAVRALREMRRVLKIGGVLLFAEHGRAPEMGVRWWQDRLTPIWKRLGGGCHLNRPIGDLIASAGFRIERLENSYMRGPRPLTYMYEGAARPLRWSSNLGIVVLDTVLVRILVPATGVGIAFLAEARGWGLFHAFAAP